VFIPRRQLMKWLFHSVESCPRFRFTHKKSGVNQQTVDTTGDRPRRPNAITFQSNPGSIAMLFVGDYDTLF